MLDRIEDVILEVEEATTLRELGGVTKLSRSDRYYRIRVGDYRIGLALVGETAVFVRCLHRKDIYRYFP